MSDPEPSLAEEHIANDEREIIARIVAVNFKTQSRIDGVAKRGQHAKHHGCVAAAFTVRDDIPEELRHGIFAAPGTLDAWIRFSNGTWYDDRKNDAHGMAIKVLNVPGPKLLPGSEDRTEQDFLLVDHPVFFTKTLAEYWTFNKYFTKILDFLKNWKNLRGFPPRLFGLIQGGVMLRLFHGDLQRRAQAFAAARPASPLAISYWSTTPYLLGSDTAVKYMARPANRGTCDTQRGVSAPDGLAQALRRELSEGPIAYEFGVHLQEDPDRQPIEDATVNWDPENARFVPLVNIEIRRHTEEELVAGMTLAENLAFSPWHALAEHRPLGNVNRARRDVYVEMAKRRLAANAVGSSGTSVQSVP